MKEDFIIINDEDWDEYQDKTYVVMMYVGHRIMIQKLCDTKKQAEAQKKSLNTLCPRCDVKIVKLKNPSKPPTQSEN